MTRPLYEKRSLAWLIAVDAVWLVPEIVGNITSLLLVPVCFAAVFFPVLISQRRAGDSRAKAALKAFPCAVAAALPFPVCGTAFGVAFLAFARGDSAAPPPLPNSATHRQDSGK